MGSRCSVTVWNSWGLAAYAVRKTVSGFLKLLYPHGEFDKEAVRKYLEYALDVRRRVKEQLKKIGGMEFYDVHFSYIDNEDLEEHFVAVKEQGGGKRVALPITSAADIPTVPGELFTKFQTSFYADPVDAVFKALGVD